MEFFIRPNSIYDDADRLGENEDEEAIKGKGGRFHAEVLFVAANISLTRICDLLGELTIHLYQCKKLIDEQSRIVMLYIITLYSPKHTKTTLKPSID
jgi:hypothetical protein